MRTGAFQLPKGGGNCQPRRNGENHVHMVRHAVDEMRYAFQGSGFSPQIAIQAFFPGRIDQRLTVLGGPDCMMEKTPVGPGFPFRIRPPVPNADDARVSGSVGQPLQSWIWGRFSILAQ